MMGGVISGLGSNPAVRSAPPGWRDPRLWVGVALVAASVVVGARVFAGADDTTAVWAAAGELAPGASVTADDLVVRQVRFAETDDLQRYLPAADDVPARSRVSRPVGAGELLPRAALVAGEALEVVEVPLAVPAGRVPASVATGSVVDVWVSEEADGDTGRAPRARRVLAEVAVLDAPPVAEEFGASGERRLVVAVPPEQARALSRALAAAVSGTVVVTRRG